MIKDKYEHTNSTTHMIFNHITKKLNSSCISAETRCVFHPILSIVISWYRFFECPCLSHSTNMEYPRPTTLFTWARTSEWHRSRASHDLTLVNPDDSLQYVTERVGSDCFLTENSYAAAGRVFPPKMEDLRCPYLVIWFSGRDYQFPLWQL